MGGIAKKAATVVGATAGSAVGGPIGGMIGKGLGDSLGGAITGEGVGVQPNAPGLDPRLKEIREGQVKQAQDFRKGIPEEKARQANMAGDASRRDLASKMAGVKASANQRGLLYSGLRQAGEGTAAAQSAADLARQTASTNAGLDEKARALESTAVTGSYNNLNQQQNMAGDALKIALEDRQARSGAMAGLGKELGSLGGGLMARRG